MGALQLGRMLEVTLLLVFFVFSFWSLCILGKWKEQTPKGPFWFSGQGGVEVAGVALTPLYLANTDYTPPEPAAVWKKQTHFLSCNPVSAVLMDTHSKHWKSMEAFTESGGLSVGRPALANVCTLISGLFTASVSYPLCLGVTMIQSYSLCLNSGIYSRLVLIFHTSCHGNISLFGLEKSFILFSACIFYIYHQICRALPIWKLETLNYVEKYF